MRFHLAQTSTFVASLVALALVGCQPRSHHYSDDEITFLASDAHVIVGEVPFTIPFVALTGYVTQGPSFSLDKEGDRKRAKDRLEEFHKSASSLDTAPPLDKLEIRLRTFGWADNDMSLGRICTRLNREWPKSICNDPWAPIQQAMPHDDNQFYLVDDRKFVAFAFHFTVGGERKSDQLQAMTLRVGQPSVVCDKISRSNTTFCTAAVLVQRHLAVVWTVWSSNAETPQRRAERE